MTPPTSTYGMRDNNTQPDVLCTVLTEFQTLNSGQTGDCLIEVITWAGLTVHSIINFPLFVVVYTTCEQENVIQCAIFN
jgi:hypothetical protein